VGWRTRDLVSVAKTLSWAISDTDCRMKAEFATDTKVKNNATFFVPWDTIHESNPQEILERHEPITTVPFLIIRKTIDSRRNRSRLHKLSFM
jgi:hypothetical protein